MPSGLSDRGCLHAGQARISSKSFEIIESPFSRPNSTPPAFSTSAHRRSGTEPKRASPLTAVYNSMIPQRGLMAARILDGTKTANDIKAEVAIEVRELTAAGLRPGLAVILAGHNAASEI